MSTGPQHYSEAESHLADAWDIGPGDAHFFFHLAAAQVHATLALAAATALGDLETDDYTDAWLRAAWPVEAGE